MSRVLNSLGVVDADTISLRGVSRLDTRGPIDANDLLLMLDVECAWCGKLFATGDCWAIIPKGPMDADEAAKAAAGESFTAHCEAVHFDCVLRRLIFVSNWRRVKGIA